MLDFLESTAIDAGKKAIGMVAGRYMDKKRLEDIFVKAGYYVANYEREKSEENELREKAFCEDNMRTLADTMWQVDEFHWEDMLGQCLDSLLGANVMTQENKVRCSKHFKEIVIHDMEQQLPQTMQRSYELQTRDNSVAILGQIEDQARDMRKLLCMVEDLRAEKTRTEQYYERQEQSDRAGAKGFDKRQGAAVQPEWNLKTMHIEGVLAKPEGWRQEMLSLTRAWKEEREQYPGWYIMPLDRRNCLKWKTRDQGLLGKKELLSIAERLEFCYEYVWRLEQGMLLYDVWTQKQVRNIWDDYRKEAVEGETEVTKEAEAHWFYIGQALLREYREDGVVDEWKTVYKILKKYVGEGNSRVEELRMEMIKFEFSRFHISNVKSEIYQWRIPKEQYTLRQQAVGLLAECGELEEALRRITELTADVAQRLQDEPQGSYWIFLKSFSVCMLQLQSLLTQGYAYWMKEYEQRQEDINRIVEQIEEGKAYFDWQEILSTVKGALLEGYAKQYEVKNPFELNRETITLFGGAQGADCETESYYLYRVLEALALPLEVNHVTLMSKLELPWIRMLLRMNTHLALFMLVRGSRQDNCKKLINRKFLAGIPQNIVDSESRFLMEILDRNLEGLSDTKPGGMGHVYNAIQQNVPTLLHRFSSRCPKQLQRELLWLIKQMMECEDLFLDYQMDSFLVGVMEQISDRVKAEELGTLLCTRICEHPSRFSENTALDIFDCYFNKSDYKTQKDNCRVESWQIEAVFALEETSIYVWRTKIARLSVLYEAGLLSDEQQARFAELIWSRVNEKTQLPDLPNRYVWSYMKLPHGKSNAPAVSIKALLLQSGLMNTMGDENGCKITMGNIRYLDELNAMAQGLERDFWSVEEVELIFEDAVSYWQVLKKKFENAKYDNMKYEFHARVRKIVRTLAEVYSSISGKVGAKVQALVQGVLEEMQSMGIGALRLAVLFCEEDELMAKIEDEMYFADDAMTVDAIEAAYSYILKSPGTLWAKQLLTSLIRILRSRKRHGLTAAIYILHNLVYSDCAAVTDEVIASIDKCLLELETDTRYERHLESDTAVKEAITVRKACTALAFQMYCHTKGTGGAGVLCWKAVAEGEEFSQVKNEWYHQKERIFL